MNRCDGIDNDVGFTLFSTFHNHAKPNGTQFMEFIWYFQVLVDYNFSVFTEDYILN